MSALNPPSDRARGEYVTRNFGDLQGLKFLPVAGIFAAWGASEAQMLTGVTWWVVFAASVVCVAVGIPVISRWYARRFGQVEPRRDPRRSARMAAVAFGLLVVGIATMMLGASGRLPQVEVVALPGIVLGVALALFGIAQGPIARREHPWTWRFGLTVAAASTLPAGAWLADGVHPLNGSGMLEFVIAGFFVVASLDTHRALVRLLPNADAGEGGPS